jgi:alanyl-tRNA synthetase
MQNPTFTNIRQTFLDFFAEKGHQIVPSAPVVNRNDPTLLFVNSGMAPFKDIFTGQRAAQFARVADTQKCMRVTGKHNDLEDVGHDTYHHTMFEMLGNWSFGDYFRAEAIAWAWELLTDRYQLPKDKLYVTVFGGDATENVPEDVESGKCWAKFLPEDHILRGSKKDNFWEMGDTGPCGPCTEIHIDLRSDEEIALVPGRDLVNRDHPQVVEIWNIVLMQFNRKASGELEPLKMKSVDTGMGLERLAMALQGKRSTYDTDAFQPLKDFLAREYGAIYNVSEERDIAIRVILDHIRAICFTMADGQLPSNTGAGYVIRRIIRRASRYGFRYLNITQPFMYLLVQVLADTYQGFFPELTAQGAFIAQVLEQEEKSFIQKLERGSKLFEEYLEQNKATKQVDGEFAFQLYDTFGFPVDLTELMAKERKLSVDIEGFEKLLAEQKERSRAAAKQETGDWIELQAGETTFVGYDLLEAEAEILKVRTLGTAKGKVYQVILSRTPFYAEGGGQVGDTGTIQQANTTLRVLDTKRENDTIVHFIDALPEDPSGSWTATVDATRRHATEANHSATHLLHAALRQVLGTHVEQRGSLVNNEYLRFDFSHFQKVTDEELAQVELLANSKIQAGITAKIRTDVPIEEAKAMGAMALFGEKYGERVRVVQFDASYSTELCGGTHVQNSRDIQYLKIVSEASVAAGVRRIEALTGSGALAWFEQQAQLLQRVNELLKHPKDTEKALQQLLEQRGDLEKRLEHLQNEALNRLASELPAHAKPLVSKTLNTLTALVDVGTADALKQLSFELRKRMTNTVILLGANLGGSPQLSLILTPDLESDSGINCSTLIRELAKDIGGGGGGQPFYATAGGKRPESLHAALEKLAGLL